MAIESEIDSEDSIPPGLLDSWTLHPGLLERLPDLRRSDGCGNFGLTGTSDSNSDLRPRTSGHGLGAPHSPLGTSRLQQTLQDADVAMASCDRPWSRVGIAHRCSINDQSVTRMQLLAMIDDLQQKMN